MTLRSLLRIFLTLAIFAAAIFIAWRLWSYYMYSPWTRDGRIRADIINVAPDESGFVIAVEVHDNQLVHRGDLLFTLDPQRFGHAVTEAQSALEVRKAELAQKRDAATRRAMMDSVVVSTESRVASDLSAGAAAAQVRQAEAQLEVARLNLQRTEIHAPVDGYVTNLNVFVGDFAVAGHPALAMVDTSSFYVYGYFEETKIPGMQADQPVEIRLMDGAHLKGHVESLSRAITDRDNLTGQELLSSVNPTFNWVRLAQRVPVRIHIDEVPDGVLLTAGMTCTVIVRPARAGGRAPAGRSAAAHAS